MPERELWDARAVAKVWYAVQDNTLHQQRNRLKLALGEHVAAVVVDIADLGWDRHTLAKGLLHSGIEGSRSGV
jgi:(p)ppGpp synthase/HD superfamily hydrolase